MKIQKHCPGIKRCPGIELWLQLVSAQKEFDNRCFLNALTPLIGTYAHTKAAIELARANSSSTEVLFNAFSLYGMDF